jgi:hypothetical protein
MQTTGSALAITPAAASQAAVSLTQSGSIASTQPNKKLITANAGEAFEKYKMKQKERVRETCYGDRWLVSVFSHEYPEF